MADTKLPDLVTIFGISKPRELKSFCRSAKISKRQLASVIQWCHSDKAVFQHTANHRQFMPDHLNLTEADLAALHTNPVGALSPAAQTAVNKTGAMFDERRMLSGHLFQGLWSWHLLYYDNRDRNERDNHWKLGPHMHLINHVLTKQTSNVIWSRFCNGNPRMSGALHIRVASEERKENRS